MMKFNIVKTMALRVLNQAYKTCSKDKESADSDFLFQESSGHLVVTTLNDSAQQNVVFPTHSLVAEPGEKFTIQAQSLLDILKQFPDEDVNCRYEPEQFVLLLSGVSRQSKIMLPCSQPEEYVPFFFTPTNKPVIQLPGNVFASALRKTVQFAHTDWRKGVLNCVHLVANGTTLKAESSDDTQMAVSNVAIEDIGQSVLELMLCEPAADSLSKMIEDVKEVTIEPGVGLVKFTWEDTILTSRLGNPAGDIFPDFYNTLTGMPIKAKLKLSRTDVVRALKLAVLMAKDSYLELNAGEEGLSVIVREGLCGAGQDVVPAIEHSGEAVAFISARALLKAVENLDSIHIELEFREQRAGGVCGCLLSDTNNFQHFLFAVQPT